MSETPIARRVISRLRRATQSTVVNLTAMRAGNAMAAALQKSVLPPELAKALNPDHAIYTYVHNQMSVQAEQLLELEELQAIAKIVGSAEDEYVPSWPPMSPITKTFFWCWALYDAAANAHRETLGSITLQVSHAFGAHPEMLTLMRALQDSRMGLHRVQEHVGARVRLRDLITGEEALATCESGYRGEPGELWYARVLAPPRPRQSAHVVFTSPYVLLAPGESDWLAYCDRMAANDAPRPRPDALERHFKWGPSRRYWSEFVFEGYVNHKPGAIYLEGLPDRPETRPHSPHYQGKRRE